jgi:isoleucyl-tRNA synthetase
MAPFTPFLAEIIYQAVRFKGEPESVHLSSWPEFAGGDLNLDAEVIDKMSKTRDLVSLGLEFRQQIQIKVRQPLSQMVIRSGELVGQESYISLIREELNIKSVNFDPALSEEVWLDRVLTKELFAEGAIRDLIRQIQEKRKLLGLNPSDQVELIIDTDDSGQQVIRDFERDLLVATGARALSFGPVSDEPVWGAGERAFRIKVISL